MKLCNVETSIAILFTVFAISFAFDNSIIDYNERIDGKDQYWLRSEGEMRWLYEEWIVEHDKSYGGDVEEKEKRFGIFKNNLQFIDEYNRPENNHTSTVGLNQFADLTNEEFRSLYLSTSINISTGPSPPVSRRYQAKRGQNLPYSVDWRSIGAVSRIKNQGICQSCRAFATVAAVEGLYKIVSGKLITLSEQELIDCDKWNQGCQPGYIHYTYQYILANGGVDTDWHYPYQGVDAVCRQDRARVVGISSFEKVPSYDEYALQRAVANQPVSVNIESKSQAFQFHRSGVFTGPCGTQTDHFVTAIGYGTDYNGIDYWLVKNSWGPSWGEGGIGKVQRNVGGAGRCGILSWSIYPVMRWRPSSDQVVDGNVGISVA